VTIVIFLFVYAVAGLHDPSTSKPQLYFSPTPSVLLVCLLALHIAITHSLFFFFLSPLYRSLVYSNLSLSAGPHDSSGEVYG